MTNRNSKDVYVALMGLTGAGKSSFINHCTKHEVTVGDGLQACTAKVEVYSFEHIPGVTIHLVDTPGFDDTNRQDSDVLRDISAWLSKSYTEKVLLNGILYLHRISDPRMQGSGKMSINLLIKLCGRDALKNVVLVTTMWELVEADVGDRREQELENTEEFWGFMKRHGSQTRRHLNSEESARKILSMFVPETPGIQAETVTLAIQTELADDHKTLDQTGAGQLLDGTWAKEKESLLRELEEVRDAVRMANEERDHTMAQLLQEQQQEMSLTVEKMKEEQEKLRVTMEQLHEERLLKYHKMLDDQLAISRTLSEDLELKTKLQEDQRNEHCATAANRMDKLQEQQAAVADLQGELADMSTSSNSAGKAKYYLSHQRVTPMESFTIHSLPQSVTFLLFSSDGERLFVGMEKKTIYIYRHSSSDGEPRWYHEQTLVCASRVSRIFSSSTGAVKCLARSNDDSYLLAGCGNKLMRFIFDPSSGKYKMNDIRQEFFEHFGELEFLALSSDKEEYLVCGGKSNNYDLCIYRPNFGLSDIPMRYLGKVSMSELTIENLGSLTCLEIGHDGTLGVGFSNGAIVMFRFEGTELIKAEWHHEAEACVLSLDWCYDGRLMFGTIYGLFICNPKEGTVTRLNKSDVLADPDCWLAQSDFDDINDKVGCYGTLLCRKPTYCVIEEDQIRPSRCQITSAHRMHGKPLSAQEISYFNIATEYSGIIQIASASYRFYPLKD